MTAPTLKDALRLVETLGLAPLNRVQHTMPRDNRGDRYVQWQRRRREVEAEVVMKLTAEGATIGESSGATRLRFVGITASSTMGIAGALRNWKAAAEKRLPHWGNGR